MKAIEYIESCYNQYLKKYQEVLVHELVLAIRNEHNAFEPYKKNPKHYILSIYDPLQLYYVLLGRRNLGVHLKFEEEQIINRELVHYFDLDAEDEDAIYHPDIIEQKRRIEYEFLRRCLAEVQLIIGRKIQLYITQHITAVAYNISEMKPVDPEYLWKNLEE